ncbi:MAG TPA: 1-acyl-sn-glycerol-3-phosphate acyltransferase [Saprospiraceae bacterium]|nr:1-acyl-sn-glycerol-3-phosphate acyltransferase [Saprospiraceae bacterium]
MIRVRLLQFMYLVFKALIGIGLRLFYPNTVVHNRQYLNTKGPMLLIGNHPNGMMDPINVALHSRRMVHFLAKSQLFSNWFTRWFFNTFYCIPVQRSNFSTDQPIDMVRSFERCDIFLHEGGTLFVAPEGTSLNVRRILPLRTGAARIALSAESKKDFQLGLRFVVSGVTYIDAGSFWSGQFISTSAPFGIEEFEETYRKDEVTAVKLVTEKIFRELKKLNIHLENDALIPDFERLIRWFNSGIEADPEQFFIKGKLLADDINRLEQNNPLLIESARTHIAVVENYMHKWHLKAEQVPESIEPTSVLSFIVHLLLAVLGLPCMLAGLVIHFIPNFLPWLIEKIAKQHPIYIATTKFVTGFFLYIIYYPLLVKWVLGMGLSGGLSLTIIAGGIICGLLFFPYINILQKLKTSFVTFFVKKNEKEMVKNEILTLQDLISGKNTH